MRICETMYATTIDCRDKDLDITMLKGANTIQTDKDGAPVRVKIRGEGLTITVLRSGTAQVFQAGLDISSADEVLRGALLEHYPDAVLSTYTLQKMDVRYTLDMAPSDAIRASAHLYSRGVDGLSNTISSILSVSSDAVRFDPDLNQNSIFFDAEKEQIPCRIDMKPGKLGLQLIYGRKRCEDVLNYALRLDSRITGVEREMENVM